MPPINWPRALAEHDRWLRTVVLARVGESAAVDDVMQEVALAVVRQRAPLADASKLAPWLYRLALTQSLLYRRKQGRRRKLHARFAERVPPSPFDRREPDPLEWLLAGESQRLVREALGRLSAREREILLLKYTENWSYSRVAEHLGTTESAVESRLFRARTRLRRELAVLEEVRLPK